MGSNLPWLGKIKKKKDYKTTFSPVSMGCPCDLKKLSAVTKSIANHQSPQICLFPNEGGMTSPLIPCSLDLSFACKRNESFWPVSLDLERTWVSMIWWRKETDIDVITKKGRIKQWPIRNRYDNIVQIEYLYFSIIKNSPLANFTCQVKSNIKSKAL